MKTLIIGYSDRGALSAPQIISGPDVSTTDQAEIIENARRLQQFPEGILRLEQYLVDQPIESAIFISEETAQACADRDAARKKSEKAAQEKRVAQQKVEATVISANKAFTSAAEKRNKAIAAVALQKDRLATNPDDRDKVLKKIEELQPIADRAIAEFQIVRELRDVIKNPKSRPEDVAAAAKLIADPAKALEIKKAAAAALPPIPPAKPPIPPAS